MGIPIQVVLDCADPPVLARSWADALGLAPTGGATLHGPAVVPHRTAGGRSAGRLLIIDFGGGSMEIVLGRDAEPDLAVSLPLGSGRLTRAFLPDDPPSRAEAT